jgi:multidrug efflux pump
MMCAYMIRGASFREGPNRLHRATEHLFQSVLASYDHSLAWALRHGRIMMLILLAVLVLMVHLFVTIPKGFFPQQDTGRLVGGLQADQSISFQLMRQKLTQFIDIIKRDTAVDTVVGFTGGSRTNSGFVFVQLKPKAERGLSADQVIARLRRELAVVPGATLFLQSVQDIRVGGRQSNAQYQYTLQGDDIEELRAWAPKIAKALEEVAELTDVNSDQQDKGLEIDVAVDRATASRLGLKMSQINSTLYDAFGQRQVSTIYNPLNQYHVIMEVAPRYWQSPETLRDIYVSTSGGSASGTQGTNALAGTVARPGGPATTAAQIATDVVRNQNTNRIASSGRGGASTGSAVSTSKEIMIPLAAFAQFAPGSTPLGISHQGQFLATTISFNLAPGVSLSDATVAIDRAMNELHVPVTIHGGFRGTAGAFQQSLGNQPILILAALIAVYVVLGILYESYIHPITILSTLPSAGVGAVLALMAFRTDFSIMALIGVILLIGIVKKNAIIMIDFAIDAERQRKLSPREAIAEACHMRFRPIMMTTMAALFGAVPLAVGIGEGSEMRQPLGIAIVGGLIVSQMLTLYTTPVIYLYFDRFRLWAQGLWRRHYHRDRGAFAPGAGE